MAFDLALPAFLSSVYGGTELTLRLLPSRLHVVSTTFDPAHVAASLEWQNRFGLAETDPVRASVQKA